MDDGTNTQFVRIIVRLFSGDFMSRASQDVLRRGVLINAALLFCAWTTYGLLSAWQAHYWFSFSKTPMSWADCLRFEMTYAWLWALATPLILYITRRFRLERNVWPRSLLVHALVMILLVAITKTLFDLIAMPPESSFRGFTWVKLFRSIESTADDGGLIYMVIVLIEHSIAYYRRYQQGLVNASHLQTELVQAQLQALRMQLHPHFLFNTLHSISALVHDDPDLAERTIARLSELLRRFLAHSTTHEAPLSEELRILELYLEIERTRFEDRLSVHYDVPAEMNDAIVPSLILQPLVENSIRHGVGKLSRNCWISISAQCYGNTAVLRVADNGPGLDDKSAEPHHTGMGLAITRGRLATLYGPNQALTLTNLPSGGVEARITMPFRKQTHGGEERENAALQSSSR